MGNSNKHILPFTALIIVLMLTACSGNSAAPAVTATAPAALATNIPASPTTVPPSPTVEPTSTPLPSATPLPTPTAIPPLALADDGFDAWCLPEGLKASADELAKVPAMPANGRTYSIVNGIPQLIYPNTTCTFAYTFNQPMPEGMMLKVFDKNAAPWLVVPLTPAADDASTGYTTITHSYIVNPPLWFITYRMVVETGDGQSMWESSVELMRNWQADLCWNGVMPNATTLKCIKQQDLHPWDPGYCLFNPCPWGEYIP